MYKTLNNGIKIPSIGFGTDGIPEGQSVINAVKWAIEKGYRLIDNADCYNNQTGVGIAIKECIQKGIVERKDIFLTNKVPDWKQGYDSTLKCAKESLKKTGLNYFDLYLIHSPLRENANWQKTVLDTYRAMETLYKEGFIKSIGVSNFEIRHLNFILNEAEIKPAINQIELHPMRGQTKVVDFCRKNDILLQGWGTLNQGRIFNNNAILEMAEKYNKNPAQIAARWSLQKGFIPLIRSCKKERIEMNFDCFNFEIKPSDMEILDGLNGGEFSGWHHDGIKPVVMVPINTVGEYSPVPYEKKYKLFNIIPILKEKKYRWNKSKWYLFNIIPILRIDKKEIDL